MSQFVREIVRGSVALLMLAALLLPASRSFAVEPDEMLKDPKLEARARALSLGLRCLVCQNQSIDDSNAELAKDLRVLVRERLAKGDTDEQAENYIVDRYGEFVLLKPRFNMHTLVLWLAPLALLLYAGWFLYTRPQLSAKATGGKKVKVKALSKEEQKKLDKLLQED